MKAWVVRTDLRGEPINGVFQELERGWARIGWSRGDNQNLQTIADCIRQGHPLDEDQRLAKRCLRFYTAVGTDDYFLYPNQPRRGHFSLAKVTGDYDYESVERDFRSRRSCKFIRDVSMRDSIVPSQLRYRLGRPGRFSEVRDTRPLELFLGALSDAGGEDSSNHRAIGRIHDDLREPLRSAIRREFSRADLSRQFCPELFDRMGYAFEVLEGPNERGSDLVATIANPLLPDGVESRVGVQVFAYEGKVKRKALREKLDQLLDGWEDNTLNYGLLLTTGECTQDAKDEVDRHNKEHTDRLVKLIEGNDLADLFLQHFPPGNT